MINLFDSNFLIEMLVGEPISENGKFLGEILSINIFDNEVITKIGCETDSITYYKLNENTRFVIANDKDNIDVDLSTFKEYIIAVMDEDYKHSCCDEFSDIIRLRIRKALLDDKETIEMNFKDISEWDFDEIPIVLNDLKIFNFTTEYTTVNNYIDNQVNGTIKASVKINLN